MASQQLNCTVLLGLFGRRFAAVSESLPFHDLFVIALVLLVRSKEYQPCWPSNAVMSVRSVFTSDLLQWH